MAANYDSPRATCRNRHFDELHLTGLVVLRYLPQSSSSRLHIEPDVKVRTIGHPPQTKSLPMLDNPQLPTTRSNPQAFILTGMIRYRQMEIVRSNEPGQQPGCNCCAPLLISAFRDRKT